MGSPQPVLETRLLTGLTTADPVPKPSGHHRNHGKATVSVAILAQAILAQTILAQVFGCNCTLDGVYVYTGNSFNHRPVFEKAGGVYVLSYMPPSSRAPGWGIRKVEAMEATMQDAIAHRPCSVSSMTTKSDTNPIMYMADDKNSGKLWAAPVFAVGHTCLSLESCDVYACGS